MIRRVRIIVLDAFENCFCACVDAHPEVLYNKNLLASGAILAIMRNLGHEKTTLMTP